MTLLCTPLQGKALAILRACAGTGSVRAFAWSDLERQFVPKVLARKAEELQARGYLTHALPAPRGPEWRQATLTAKGQQALMEATDG